ncbi:MAG: UvrD-helicase domain-containing protein, partial [Peptoniphilaceae bacterium]
MSYDRSVFLTAGAGAGKTKVLTQNIFVGIRQNLLHSLGEH